MRFWMIRAGEGGHLLPQFEQLGHVGIGWADVGDLSGVKSAEEIRERLRTTSPDASPGWIANSAGMLSKFRLSAEPGDRVVSYDGRHRVYSLGTIRSPYRFRPDLFEGYPHVREVTWEGHVSRDALGAATRNTLGSTLTLFEPGLEILGEMEAAGTGVAVKPSVVEDAEPESELQVLRRDLIDKAHEFIKDRILSLSPESLEELTAALLRAMGYRARVTPKGPDRGRDVIASPDGLGFQSPRIMAEVKHRRNEAMGSQQVRSFIGGLRENDRGLFVSVGGFTREARYEADRASVPVTLVDLDDLATLVVEHYDRFDLDGRGLLPLVRIYWPAAL